VFEILGSKHIGVTILTFQGHGHHHHRSRDHRLAVGHLLLWSFRTEPTVL